MTMARKGKIARLPQEIRDRICLLMADGITDVKIAETLNADPAVQAKLAEYEGGGVKSKPEITDGNLSEWRQGGYQDWLGDQSKVRRVRVLAEYAQRMADADGGSAAAGGVAVAAGRLFERLEGAADEDLEKLIKPLVALRIAETEAIKAGANRKRADLAESQLVLDREKFRRETTKLFMKWIKDTKILAIVNSDKSDDVKMDNLAVALWGTKEDHQ
jgi:preprotein translocase subunit SecD